MTHNPAQKALFGAFLNTAQHNAYLIINEVNERLGKSDVKEGSLPSAIDNLFNPQKAKLKDRKFTAHFLVAHFPFLRAFANDDADIAEDQIDTIWKLLNNSLQRLNKERNVNSHWKKQTIDFSLPENAMLKVDLDSLKNRFLTWLGDEGTKQREIANRKYPEIGKNQYKYIQKYSFSYPFWEDTNKPQQDFSDWGLAYFTCLFLEKKQANLFLSSIKGLKNTSNENFRAVRAFYTHHCCLLPQPRLESSDILLDMLGELRRCPALLYDLLSDKDKAYFQHNITYKAGFNAEKIEEVAISKRYDDRLPYFILRYLDDTNSLPDIRFQLYVGKVVHKKYEAKIIGELTDRYLLKEIHVFDKLSDYREKTPTWTINNAPNPETNPLEVGQMTQYSPQYNLSGNRVYLKVGLSKEDEGKTNLAPNAVISIHELPNLLLYSHLYPKKSEKDNTSPTQIFISKYIGLYRKFIKAFQENKIEPIVLPPDFYKKRLKGKASKDMKISQVKVALPYSATELAEMDARRERLQAKLDAEFNGLKWHYLPDDIKEYLLGFQQNSYRYKALFFIDYLKNETNERLHRIKIINNRKKEDKERAENEDREIKTRTLKAGDIAQWLAKDLIFLKRPDGSKKNDGKPNNQQYDRLQELLAYFPLNRNLIDRFFNELGFYSGAGKHPFIEQVNPKDFHTLFSFYEKYLGERKKYFISVYQKMDLISFFTNQIGFDYLKNYDKKKKGNVQKQLQNHLEHFDKVALKKLFEKNQIQDLQNIDKWKDLEEFFEKYPKRFNREKILKNEEIADIYGYLFSFDYQQSNKPNKNYEKPNPTSDYKIPIALPAGLFRDAIIDALQQKGLSLKPEDNVLHAFKLWQKEDKQGFYSFPRHYKMHRPKEMNQSAFEELEMQQFEKEILNDRKNTVESFRIKIDDWDKSTNESEIKKGKALKKYRDRILYTEKLLRFEEHKDRVLWLMARSLANNQEFRQKGGVEITAINDFSLASLESFLNTYVEMSVKIANTSGKVAQVFEKVEDESGNKTINILEREIIDEKTGKKTVQKIPKVVGEDDFVALSIKDYGDLRKFAKDRRLPELFEYFPNQTFSKTQLERALSHLEQSREEILQKAMDLEEAIEGKWQSEYYASQPAIKTIMKNYKKAEDKEEAFSHKFYIYFLIDKLGIPHELLPFIDTSKPQEEQQVLVSELIYKLRNKLIHNEIPYNDFLKSKMQAGFTPKQVVCQIIDESLRIYDRLIAEVEKAPA
jgi:hypothetical protein